MKYLPETEEPLEAEMREAGVINWEEFMEAGKVREREGGRDREGREGETEGQREEESNGGRKGERERGKNYFIPYTGKFILHFIFANRRN